ncbi:hypothetical protein HUZ36_04740 [Pseudoalteromonas sp. McH1-7]|uniref:hypothetical protein n=1 Tax=Pseudoalteromonas sp. McH1-7 TaxID=2745574 RepID=UPI001591A522|nr:hypothetical protein [Pseudoalteromonas sp. McH1-7]NUZ10080.1 hypothetical protein [Pseudoalteromonas sp. McH1-7]
MSFKSWCMVIGFVLLTVALLITYDLFYNAIGLNPFDGFETDLQTVCTKVCSMIACFVIGGLCLDQSR